MIVTDLEFLLLLYVTGISTETSEHYLIYCNNHKKHGDKLFEQVREITACKTSISANADGPCDTVKGEINSGLSSTALLISANSMPWRNFSKATVAQAKIGHMNITTPLLGVICHPFGNLPIYKI